MAEKFLADFRRARARDDLAHVEVAHGDFKRGEKLTNRLKPADVEGGLNHRSEGCGAIGQREETPEEERFA